MEIYVVPKNNLLFKIRSINCIKFMEVILSLGQKQGPQEFIVELFNFLNSDFKIHSIRSDLSINRFVKEYLQYIFQKNNLFL